MFPPRIVPSQLQFSSRCRESGRQARKASRPPLHPRPRQRVCAAEVGGMMGTRAARIGAGIVRARGIWILANQTLAEIDGLTAQKMVGITHQEVGQHLGLPEAEIERFLEAWSAGD